VSKPLTAHAALVCQSAHTCNTTYNTSVLDLGVVISTSASNLHASYAMLGPDPSI
jgi:hypothetical protein